MIEFKAEKAIEIKNILGIAKVSYKSYRPDIQWLLHNLSKSEDSSMEIKNLEDQLENYFELTKNEKLTPDGREAIKSGQVFDPEYGLFQIFYIDEPVLQKKYVINIERIKPDKIIPDVINNFEDFNQLEGEWVSWNQKPYTFRIFFEHDQKNLPMIIEKPSIDATLQIYSENQDQIWVKITSKNNQYSYTEDISSNFSLEQNLGLLFQNWDVDSHSLLMKYNEIKDPYQKSTFVCNKEIESCDLEFNWGKDSGNYHVRISNIPILPREIEDANNWLFDLIIERIKTQIGYFTSKFLQNEELQILQNCPLLTRFPNLLINESECLQKLSTMKAFEIVVKEIIVADDLIPIGGIL